MGLRGTRRVSRVRARSASRRRVAPVRWRLRLCGAGQTSGSVRASENIEYVREENPAGLHRTEVVGLPQSPQLARGDQIVASPVPMRKLPEPVHKIVGDPSNADKVLVGLDLRPGR